MSPRLTCPQATLERRRAQNRKAQRVFRERKERAVQSLNRQIQALQAEIARRASVNKKLDEVASSLEERLRELEDERRECLIGSSGSGEWYMGS